jgi:signal transduction histidine kinase
MTAIDPGAPPIRWRWIMAFWCAGAIFEAGQSIFMFHSEGKQGGELRLFLTEAITWLPWVLATPFVIRLARRYPILPRASVRGALLHLAGLTIISLAAEAWAAALQVAFNPWAKRHPPQFWDTWSTNLIYQALNCLVAYALILTITYLVDSRDNAARRTTEAARLSEELSKAQLAALRRQIEPHFMFNTLNSIAALVRDNCNAAAINMIVGLSEFLRRASEDAHRPQVSLAEEVEYLQRYVDIQKVRFGDRLRVTIDIPPDLLAAQVPGLLLQPLVENAIKHGVGLRVAGGAVRVAAARCERQLRISVYNDGDVSDSRPDSAGAGVGLANLRARLQILYGEAAELRLDRVGRQGTDVVATLPFVEA